MSSGNYQGRIESSREDILCEEVPENLELLTISFIISIANEETQGIST